MKVIIEKFDGDDPKLVERVVSALGPVLPEIDLEVKAKARSVTKGRGADVSNFDGILCPARATGITGYFCAHRQWDGFDNKGLRIRPEKLPHIEYLALLETKRDPHTQGPRGKGAVVVYAPVIGHEEIARNRYRFKVGEPVFLDQPIPAGGVWVRNRRYIPLAKLLNANTLAELF